MLITGTTPAGLKPNCFTSRKKLSRFRFRFEYPASIREQSFLYPTFTGAQRTGKQNNDSYPEAKKNRYIFLLILFPSVNASPLHYNRDLGVIIFRRNEGPFHEKTSGSRC